MPHKRPLEDTQHHAHLLQHVAVVVDPGLVEPDRGVAALFRMISVHSLQARPRWNLAPAYGGVGFRVNVLHFG